MATNTIVDVVMPQMGVSVSEGTVTKWLKREGEAIAPDEPLLEISTDKVDTEIPSPGSGVVQQILVQEGETVAVGTRIAVIAPEGAAAPPAEERPQALIDQLSLGGILIVPVGRDPTTQVVERIVKSESGLQRDTLMPVRFVPLVTGALPVLGQG